jgi:modulator of FtsH protease
MSTLVDRYGRSLERTRNHHYIRQVYGWLLAGLLATSATAWASLNLGTPVFQRVDGEAMVLPPLVARFVAHPVLSGGLFLGFGILAVVARKAEISSAAAYLFFATFSGLFLGPCLYLAEWDAAHHVMLSAHPIRDTFVITVGSFVGLTTYVWRTGKDFEFLGGMLYTGLWVVILAGCLALFLGSNVLSLAVCSVGTIVFLGYILFDTSRVLAGKNDDAVGDALALYLDVINLFVNLLRILSNTTSDD